MLWLRLVSFTYIFISLCTIRRFFAFIRNLFESHHHATPLWLIPHLIFLLSSILVQQIPPPLPRAHELAAFYKRDRGAKSLATESPSLLAQIARYYRGYVYRCIDSVYVQLARRAPSTKEFCTHCVRSLSLYIFLSLDTSRYLPQFTYYRSRIFVYSEFLLYIRRKNCVQTRWGLARNFNGYRALNSIRKINL